MGLKALYESQQARSWASEGNPTFGIFLLIPFHILRDGFKEEINDPTLLSLAP